MQRVKHKNNKAKSSIHAANKSRDLEKSRSQQANYRGAGHHKKRLAEDDDSDFSFWLRHPALLILFGGGALAVAAYAVYASTNTASEQRQLPTGSSRATGRETIPPSVAKTSMFKQVERSAEQARPKTRQAPVKSRQEDMTRVVQKTTNNNVNKYNLQPTIVKADVDDKGNVKNINDIALFKGVHALLQQENPLISFYRLIAASPARSLQAKHDVSNIPAHHVKWPLNGKVNLINANQITALQYAFLAGRADAFALLLNAGAELGGRFRFGFHIDVDKHGKQIEIETSLEDILFQHQHHPLVIELCAPKMVHEILIAYLIRKDFTKASKLIRHPFEKLHHLAFALNDKITTNRAMRIFEYLPSPAYLHLGLGELRRGYEEFLMNIHFEFACLQADAKASRQFFKYYDAAALQLAIAKLDEYTNYLEKLLSNINQNLNRNEFFYRRAARLILQFEEYPHINYEAVYTDNIRTKMNDAIRLHYKDGLPEESHETMKVRIQALYNMVDTLPNERYLTCMMNFLANHTSENIVAPEDIVIHIKSLLLKDIRPISAKNIKNVMQEIIAYLDEKVQMSHQGGTLKRQ